MRRTFPLSFVFVFVAYATSGQTAPQQPSKQEASPVISQFVLYAERSVKLGEHSHADDGDVGVRSATAPKGGVAQLIVGRHTKCRNAFAPSTTIENDAEVRDLWTNTLNRDPDSEIKRQGKFPAAAMPPLPLASASGTGASVTVEHEEVVSLSPGVYGAIKLGHHSTLKLAPGTYTFASLRMEEGSEMLGERTHATDSVDLRIVGELWMERHAEIEPHWDDAKARNFTIEVTGSDPTVITPGTKLTPTTIVSLGHESKIHALLAAPHGTVWMGDEFKLKGAIAAFDIVAGEQVKVEFESGFPVAPPGSQGTQQLHGYYGMTPDSALAPLVGPVPQTDFVHLAIGLPATNAAGLQTLAAQVSDPKNASYRKYLTVDQFAVTFGATPSDYNALTLWAQSKGLHVDATYRSNLLVSVTGTASQIEQALYANLAYRLRVDGSQFVTVDRDPSLDLSVALLRISGLNDSVPHRPKLRRSEPIGAAVTTFPPMVGSGPAGTFGGNDFRTAYASGVTLNGAGQTVALLEFDGFFANDITAYETLFGLPNVPIQTQLENGFNGTPSTTALNVAEVSLDIEMAIAMAPGLNAVISYEGTQANSILGAIAAPPTGVPFSRQASTSWGYNIDDNTRQILLEFAVQGQSFCDASGDNGAFPSDPGDDRDQPYTTLVGGTVLSMNGSGASYQSETSWSGSGGGILTNLPIPTYQTGINFSTDGGSTSFRNAPDLALVASGVLVISNQGQQSTNGGTSIAAPLWAGFVALANQQAQAAGIGAVSFANPLLATIGESPSQYSTDFNDITTGNNVVGTPNQFNAVAGFDLVTGWGSPKPGLINALSGVPPPSSASSVTINYHQVGACNGYVNSFGGVSAGANFAYVIFGIESIDASLSTSNFAFDPTLLFVHQATDDFFDPSLQLYTDILGPFAAIATTVTKGTDLKFSTNAYGATVVATVNSNGAIEANNTAYFLRYKAAASDPTIIMVKTDSSRTSWPLTEDCTTIVLK